jgi:hypothetical protein
MSGYKQGQTLCLPASLALSASNSYRFSVPSFQTVILKRFGVLEYCLQAVIDVTWNDEVFMLSKKAFVSVGMICYVKAKSVSPPRTGKGTARLRECNPRRSPRYVRACRWAFCAVPCTCDMSIRNPYVNRNAAWTARNLA